LVAIIRGPLLPSSHYDSVGLRFTIITRLNRFTCVTARSSLVPTLNSCRCLHEPKARFPVGRLVPLSEAGISPAGSIRLFLTHRIGDAAQPRSEWRQWRQIVGRLDARAHLSVMPSACTLDCNTSHTHPHLSQSTSCLRPAPVISRTETL
jgi:hypothetical protein